MTEKTKEPQYQFLLDLEKEGLETLGLMSSQVWREDPRRLLFVLSRYKFVAKMCVGLRRVLEVGCADGFGTRIVRQEVPEVVAVDFDPVFIRRNLERPPGSWNVDFRVHDMLAGPLREDFDAVYAVDVIEHIPADRELEFVGNMVASLKPEGFALLGTPSLESQAYASAPSREGHVNCKTAKDLRALMARFFHNVFVFSMNDEVVHTGYPAMAHYLWALGAHRKPA